MNKALDDYYLLSEIVEDDIIIVALMVGLFNMRVDTKILKDLESLNLQKHSKPLEMLLECDIKAIRGFKMILNDIAINYKINKEVKEVSKDTNLLDLMEKGLI